jgi:hypothetical protein
MPPKVSIGGGQVRGTIGASAIGEGKHNHGAQPPPHVLTVLLGAWAEQPLKSAEAVSHSGFTRFRATFLGRVARMSGAIRGSRHRRAAVPGAVATASRWRPQPRYARAGRALSSMQWTLESLPPVSALIGSLVGGVSTFAASRFTQRGQVRTQTVVQRAMLREALFLPVEIEPCYRSRDKAVRSTQG